MICVCVCVCVCVDNHHTEVSMWLIVNMLDCEFDLQWRYDVHFRTNTLVKDIEPFYTSPMGK